jgi:hypothetical protein
MTRKIKRFCIKIANISIEESELRYVFIKKSYFLLSTIRLIGSCSVIVLPIFSLASM